jgi:hypothetical protein
MSDHTPKALFVGNGAIYPDHLICSGAVPGELGGKPCPFSVAGRMPDVLPLDAAAPTYTIDQGKPGDLCPPCAKQALGSLGHWDGHAGLHVAPELQKLRLFKCRMWFWLVVPGLNDDAPATILPPTPDTPDTECR